MSVELVWEPAWETSMMSTRPWSAAAGPGDCATEAMAPEDVAAATPAISGAETPSSLPVRSSFPRSFCG
ncbi:MAG: hypothetical protein Q7W02_22810 [Candidatus Rokubacteria bacterium]|nr:hypothetical protein [Candidatus Rokubacteria bacterium]